jgi:two-component system, NarL family, sensor kinase
MNKIIPYYIFLFLLLTTQSSMCQNTVNDTSLINNLLNLGRKIQGIKRDSALIYFQNALELSQKIDNKKFIATSKMRIGYLHYLMGKMNTAITMLEESRDLANLYHIDDVKISSDISIAIIYDNLGKYAESYELLNKIYLQCDSMHMEKYKIMVAVNMSKSMISMQHWKEGVDVAKKAIDLATAQKDYMGRCITYNNLAVCYKELGQYDEAIKASRIAYKDAVIKGFTQEQERFFSYMGTIYQQTGQLDSALYYGKKAVEITTKNKNDFILIAARWHLGDVYMHLKKYKEAMVQADSSLAISKKHHIISDIVNAYQLKYEISKAANNLPDLKANANSLIFWKDSLGRLNLDNKVANVEEKANNDLLRKDLALQAIQIENEKTKRNNLLMGLAGLALIVTSLTFYFNKRKRDKLKLELEKKFGIQMINEMDGYRKEVASTLHDDIGQHLLLIKQYFKKQNNIDSKSDELLEEIIHKVRGLSRQNFPHQIEYIGLSAALNELYDLVENKSNLKIIDDFCINENNIDKTVSIHIYRIIQELITNSLKHSKATAAWIYMHQENGELKLEYKENSLVHMDLSMIHKPQSLGWKMIQHRLEILNGNVSIQNNGEGMQTFVFHFSNMKIK